MTWGRRICRTGWRLEVDGPSCLFQVQVHTLMPTSAGTPEEHVGPKQSPAAKVTNASHHVHPNLPSRAQDNCATAAGFCLSALVYRVCGLSWSRGEREEVTMSESERQASLPVCSPGIWILSQGAGRWEITHTDQHLGKGTHQIPWHNTSFQNVLRKRIPTSPPDCNSFYLTLEIMSNSKFEGHS